MKLTIDQANHSIECGTCSLQLEAEYGADTKTAKIYGAIGVTKDRVLVANVTGVKDGVLAHEAFDQVVLNDLLTALGGTKEQQEKFHGYLSLLISRWMLDTLRR